MRGDPHRDLAGGGVSVRVRGDAELAAALTAIGGGLGHLEAGAARAAEILAADARGRAPKRTGTLAASIRGRAQGSAATVGTPVRYGRPVHSGVPSRNQRPQPFLAEAVKAQDSAILAAYAKDAQALIDRSV